MAKATIDTPTTAGFRKRSRSEHRVLGRHFVDEEDDHEHHRGDEQADDGRAGPAVVVAAHQGEDQNEEAERERDEPDPVDPPRAGIAVDSAILVSVMMMATDADGHIDEEDPSPSDGTGDGAADQRADGHGAAGHRPVDPEGGASVLTLEGLGDQGQRGGEHDGAAHPLHRPGQVQHERVGREAADQRGQGEHGQPAPRRRRGARTCRR